MITRKRFRPNPMPAMCSGTVLALALSACGGGGGGSSALAPIAPPSTGGSGTTVQSSPSPSAAPAASSSPSAPTSQVRLVDYATPHNDILGVYTGPDGNIWFPEANTGNLYKASSNGVVTAVGPMGVNLSALLTGPDKRIYVSTGTGVGGFDPSNGKLTVIQALNKTWLPEQGVVAGDGTLWYTDSLYNAIDVLTTTTSVAQYPLPTAKADPRSPVVGPDGNIWFVESAANKIGMITRAGQITEYPLPPLPKNPGPAGIAAGPDGNLWFTEAQDPGFGGGFVGRITPSGQITQFNAQGRYTMVPIVAGPDGNMWIGATHSSELIRVTMSGDMTFYPLPARVPLDPLTLAVSADGTIWFDENWAGRIGKVVFQ